MSTLSRHSDVAAAASCGLQASSCRGLERAYACGISAAREPVSAVQEDPGTVSVMKLKQQRKPVGNPQGLSTYPTGCGRSPVYAPEGHRNLAQGGAKRNPGKLAQHSVKPTERSSSSNVWCLPSPATRVISRLWYRTQGFARTSLHPGLSSVVHFVDYGICFPVSTHAQPFVSKTICVNRGTHSKASTPC